MKRRLLIVVAAISIGLQSGVQVSWSQAAGCATIDTAPKDPYDPSALTQYGDTVLLAYYLSGKVFVGRDPEANERLARAEILHRHLTDQLLCALSGSYRFPFASLKAGELLSQMADNAVDPYVRPYINSPDAEVAFAATVYFARQGQLWALDFLNSNFYDYQMSSAVWADTVLLFGEFHYTKAARNLVEGLGSASFNMADACAQTLQSMFPDAKVNANDLNELQTYWRGYVERHLAEDGSPLPGPK